MSTFVDSALAMKIRKSMLTAGATLLASINLIPAGQAAEFPAGWTTAWATALQSIPQRPDLPALYETPNVAGRTVRQVVYPTLGGHMIRLHVSNEYGRAPLAIRELMIAPSTGAAAIEGARAARVAFDGRPSISVPPGAEVDSDPVQFDIAPGRAYAVSAYMGPEQTMAGWHRVASQVSYVSSPGNYADDSSGAAYGQRFTQHAWVTALSVEAPRASTVAAIGDSITDGMRSTLNENRRWPDALARRLQAEGRADVAVINLGISGNRLLSDSPCYGDALERRFERDVVARPGVRTAILLIGINDIDFQAMPPRAGLDCDYPHTRVSADDLVAGYRRVIAQAHAHGIRIFGATLTPASLPPQRETIRVAANRWIRTGGAFDGVIDFDAALRDPSDPVRLRRAYDSGDHIHPSDAGYAAMADAVPLAALVAK